MIYLRQSTASQEVPLGYFVDSTDGDTEETGLTIANTDIKIWKAGATTLANKNSGGATHISNGVYYAVLDATDTNTLGSLVIFVHVSGALAVKVDCVVLAANVYDSLIAGSDLLDVNASQLGGTSQTGNDVGADVDAILTDTADMQPKFGTVSDLGSGATLAGNLSDMAGATFATSTDSLEAIRDRGDAAWTTGAGGTPPDLLASTTIATLASQTSFTLTAGSADDDAYNGALVVVTDASTSTQKAVGQVSDYTGSTRTVTLSADPGIFTMAVGDSIAIVAVGQATASVDTAAIADAVWDEALSGHTTAGSAGKAVADIETDATAILADTADMQPKIGTPAGGTLAADLAAIEGEVDAVLTSTTIDGVVVDWSAIVNPTATKSFTNTTIAVTSAVAGNVGGTVGGIAGTITSLDALDTAQDTQHATTQSAISALNDVAATDIVSGGAITTSGGAVSTVTAVTNRVTANTDQIAGSATAATNLSSSAAGLVPSTVNDASATTTSFVTALTEATDDHYNGRIITFTSGALAGQSTDITDYNGTTKAVTVTALTEAPANGVSFVIS